MRLCSSARGFSARRTTCNHLDHQTANMLLSSLPSSAVSRMKARSQAWLVWKTGTEAHRGTQTRTDAQSQRPSAAHATQPTFPCHVNTTAVSLSAVAVAVKAIFSMLFPSWLRCARCHKLAVVQKQRNRQRCSLSTTPTFHSDLASQPTQPHVGLGWRRETTQPRRTLLQKT